MNKSTTNQSKNLSLYIVITICSLLMGFSTKVLADTFPSQANSILLSENTDRQTKEIEAFINSKYNYCDSVILGDFWGQSVAESKARIGRKVLWGDGGIPYLEQYLVDARIEALDKLSPPCTYTDVGYTYDDAVTLATFWGDSSPWEAKERIVRNLMLGNQDEIDWALNKTGRR